MDLTATFKLAFEIDYTQRYGHLNEGQDIECIELEVVAERVLPGVTIVEGQPSEGERNELESYFGLNDKPMSTAVVARSSLKKSETFAGPLVIYEEGATTVIPPGALGTVLGDGSLKVDVRSLRQ